VTRNPIANAGQFAAEPEVLEMWRRPETKAARDHAAQLWRVGHGCDVPDDVRGDFDAAMDSWVTNYLFKAAAMDPGQPRFVRNFMPAYSWDGRDVPDARMGADNPDNCYRLCGIAHGGRYRIEGRVPAPAPAHVSFTLVENWGTSVTAQTIELADLEIGPDGRLVITIDDLPADGRANHLTTTPRVKFLFVRDSLMDWAAETPLELAIERLDGEAGAPPALEARLEEALRRMREDVPLYYWFFRLSAGHEPNSMAPPLRTASVGGLVTQASSLGRLRLPPETAAIVRYDPAGAAYSSLNLAMWWYRSIDAHRRQSGLTTRMARPGTDGTVTCVVSARDPGIFNWIDTGGYRDLLPMIRWQGLPAQAVGGGPRHWLEIVPFDELEARLPPDVARIGAGERDRQIAARRAAWNRRIAP
jgi:hypothetical protein